MALGWHEIKITGVVDEDGPLIHGEPTAIYAAPAGTPSPSIDDAGCLEDERWELIHPAVPDFPPED